MQPASPDQPRRLLTELHRLIVDRAAAEDELSVDTRSRSEATEREYQAVQNRLAERYRAQKTALEREYASLKNGAEQKALAEQEALKKEYEAERARIQIQFTADQEAAQHALQDAHWEAMEASDAARGGLNLPLKELLAGLEQRWQQLEEILQQASALMQRRGHWESVPPPTATAVVLENHPGRRFCHALEQAQGQYKILHGQFLPKLFLGLRPLAMFFALWAVAAVVTLSLMDWKDWRWAPLSCLAAAMVGGVVGIIVYSIAKRRSIDAFLTLRQTFLQTGLGHASILETAKAECQKLDATILARHKAQTQTADQNYAAAITRSEQRRRKSLQDLEASVTCRSEELADWQQRTVREVEDKYPPKLRHLEEQFVAESERLRAEHTRQVEESQRRLENQWTAMAGRWQQGYADLDAEARQLVAAAKEQFPDWNSDDWSRWTPAVEMPSSIAIANSTIDLAQIARGVPNDPRLRPQDSALTLPLLLPFPRRSLLLLKASGAGRAQSIDLMQSAMLRMLTALPPGKVRFTIIDPVGLGDNFSAFMHLVDFDEQLVSSRIWTDAAHIEQRLADLTKHMENVIQVYLRQEFHSIEEYNASAGEMAEPCRVLVIANFPANFSEAATQRLKSIVASGARCGVFVMMSVDANTPLPRHVQLADFESEALSLRWTDERFVWDHADVGALPVHFPAPPSADRFKDIVRTVGSAAKDSGRVEVPFSYIIPEPSQWWTSDSRAGIEVPLGRAGAMKLQSLDLGRGTSQHVLISGKTGSGKSTLLHVLITNLALRYSPNEVELYLVDFKKGVEFKAYARSNLPHARVIAIESEREFGLSVLQRLDAELRDRGDLFRRRGLQDLKSYRNAEPTARLPRILLIIDEFQELFVEDDRIAQESALLLDRLVRQGRAFGIHVLLGSQTLGGAYTLARSTIGQMAVRIALQCSEADAHLILSEDNTAARLLTRPGEAIYNDANGLYEGNHPFQIVWLSDSDRDNYLHEIEDLTRQRQLRSPLPIVFEGNVLADLKDNPVLQATIDSADWPAPSPATPAWLGAAVAIKDPTAAVFARQNGSNLLVVGHREEAALGVLSASLVSLMAQHRPEDAKFIVLDGMRADAPEVGLWKRLADTARQPFSIAGVRDVTAAIEEVTAELLLREQGGQENVAPFYLIVYNLARFRELRKEDDFGFSMGSDDQSVSPAKQFSRILREGPPHGIHTLVWCDTYSNVARMLDRQSLQDFEMRVLFQMNANDSSSLMDSPEATRLGVHRAILYDEGQGIAEKFRPYGLPSRDYLAWFAERLATRAPTQ